jgi:hypothetical protein
MRISQVIPVLRLEIRKSFFSKRGLWIYLLALAPLLIIGGHSIEATRRLDNRDRLHRSHPGVTAEKLRSIRTGMTREELVSKLGEPGNPFKFRRRIRGELRERESFQYSDGRSIAYVDVENGRVLRYRMRSSCNPLEETRIYAGIFQFFFIRLCVFFGCVLVFINLFRGEMLDKSLHYYFLAPVRREVVVAGKYLAGLLATAVIFGTSVALQNYVWLSHFDEQITQEYLRGDGWYHVLSYTGVTVLACAGYGAVFLAAGVLIRNPLVPAVAMLLWESANPILPTALARISVIHYLKSLCPVEVPVDPGMPPVIAALVINGDPAAPWVAIGGVLAVALGVLLVAAWRSRRLEIAYGGD